MFGLSGTPNLPCVSNIYAESAKTPAKQDLSPFFAFASQPCCLLDREGAFRRLNPAWRRAFGGAEEELIGRRFLDLVRREDRAAVAAELAAIADGGASRSLQVRLCGKDGGRRRLRLRAVGWPERGAVCLIAGDADSPPTLEREWIEAGDRERQRLGRELHDGLCQNLAGIAALSATLARKLALRGDPAQAAAAEITVLLQQAIGDARDLARGLDVGGLARIGLAAALEVLAANVAALHPVACSFACDGDFPRLSRDIEAHLYRIAQEAVGNALAHARGRRIRVSLRLRKGSGVLRIRDDGVGMARGGGPGVGLCTMDCRSRLIGARLRAGPAALRGTLVECTFPIAPASV